VATTAAVIAVAAAGTRSVVRANVVLIPYLAAMVLCVALLTPRHRAITAVFRHQHGGWLVPALLYLSYNVFTGIIVLLGLGPTLSSRRHSVLAAGAGAVVLSLLALAEHHTLGAMKEVGALPMVDAAAAVHALWGVLFGVCLWIALFTTGVAEAYALGQQYSPRILWILLGSALFGLVQFDRLVAVLYPVMGMVAVLSWIPLVYRGPNRGPGG
jgi:uncharacterized membrane protein YkvI